MIESFTVPGDPVPKGRPRVALRGGRAMAYTPKRTELWESTAAVLIRAQRGPVPPIDGPVKLTVEAVCRRPARLRRKQDDPHRLWRTSRPDIDNVCKAVMDALTLSGALKDDSQVVYLVGLSWYAGKTEGPCVSIQVEPAPGTEPAATWYDPERVRAGGVG